MTRTITIYDWNNKATCYGLPNKEILALHVMVISGDEWVEVIFADGSKEEFIANLNNRLADCYDDSYSVMGFNCIEEWLNFKPTEGCIASYERAKTFKGRVVKPDGTITVTEDMCCGQPFLSQAGQWICTDDKNYVFFDKTTDKVWRVTEISDEIVFEEE